jgi:hypothetical protein
VQKMQGHRIFPRTVDRDIRVAQVNSDLPFATSLADGDGEDHVRTKRCSFDEKSANASE